MFNDNIIGIIHENNAKITDFGISKVENNSSIQIGTFVTITIAIIDNIREGAVPDTPEDYEKLYKIAEARNPSKDPTIIEILEVFQRWALK
ncbi:16465_t:CDS:2 [Funneliformis mosseae]|uniref:16465_t:CDS:1 n=1 Tax=Funneliformis mosseae TaxID=27381 RepID=A0A9N9CJE9_FUNMO|nr:16465_t:CDS:2 [Funneliformis mosseae]